MFKRLGSGKWCAGEASEYGVYRPFQKIKKSKLSVRHTGTVDPEAERLCVFKTPTGLAASRAAGQSDCVVSLQLEERGRGGPVRGEGAGGVGEVGRGSVGWWWWRGRGV